MSVGEWLNDVIRPEDEDYGERARYADDDRGYGEPYRDSERESDHAPRRESRHDSTAIPAAIPTMGRASKIRNRGAVKAATDPRAGIASGIRSATKTATMTAPRIAIRRASAKRPELPPVPATRSGI